MKPSDRFSTSFFSAFFLLLLLSCHANGLLDHHKAKASFQRTNVIQGRYIVELTNPDSVSPFVNLLTATFADHVKVGQRFTHFDFNGVSFSLSSPYSRHDALLRSVFDHANVVSVYPSTRMNAPTFAPMENPGESSISKAISDVISPHHLTQVDRVHEELKHTGKGILIGIIDSGVDYYHPALGGGFGKGFKVRYGYDLVGDAYNLTSDNPVIKPGPTPLDNCGPETGSVGHGTHVAGIIAGKSDNFTGVAPDATLAAWRIFGCGGGVADEIIIEALLKAEEAGCDIINLSVGGPSGWSESATAVVASRIARKGIHVIVAAGNEGENGSFTIGSPATGEEVVAVASFDNTNTLAPHFKASGTKEPIAFLSSSKKAHIYTSSELIIGDYNIGILGSGCSVPASVKGKYGLVREGSCPLRTKAANLAEAGALGLVIYDDDNETPYTPSVANASISILAISRKAGQALRARLEHDKPVVLSFLGQLPIPLTTAKTVSSFSSIGATFDLDLRPHIGAIGGKVYSTLPRKLGSWGIMSGTSMASPYMAGSVALYLNSLENKKKVNAKMVREQFQNYAYRAPVENGVKDLDSPLRQGAGLIQVYDTITQAVHISPGYISFNDTSSNNYKTHTLSITNHGDDFVSYQVVNDVSLSIAPYNLQIEGYVYAEPINYTTSAAKLRLSQKNIRLGPKKTVQVTVTVIPPKVDPKQHIMYGGFIRFQPSNAKTYQDLSVPYIGVVGRQKDLPMFDVDTPFIMNASHTSIAYDQDDTFVIHRNDNASAINLVFRLLTGTRLLRYELVEVTSDKVIGQFLPEMTYQYRNTLDSTVQLYSLPLDGTYAPLVEQEASSPNTENSNSSIPIPHGRYKIRVRALHLFGDPKKQGDFEIWESGIIKVVD